ncbi:MAG: NADH:ubiquinone reductase (Na(+)-transporting) subunit A [Bernardetiaceae bacterium]|nr:NADH:ubiquinone reductase (Na(+)-transporting) subunit A [Bernardetiaceae bacterium]
MQMQIKIKKGFDINLAGKAQETLAKSEQPETFAIKPTDFPGMYRPKVLVKEGATVKAGTPIFYDKGLEKVMYTSPVSGEVVEIKRGAKRKILEFRILADKEIQYEEFPSCTISEIGGLDKQAVMDTLLKSGAWLNIIQRPFGIVANPDEAPRDIFISAFDTHPLAPNYEFSLKGETQNFQAGIDILNKIADCKIHLSQNGNGEVSTVFKDIRGVHEYQISGPHPAGNVGVQISKIAPINKNDIVWTLKPYGVIQIGKLFLEGKYDASKIIALVGSEINNPQYYKTYIGANIDKIVKPAIKGDAYRKETHYERNPEGEIVPKEVKVPNLRYISGNVLTGTSLDGDGYLGFYDDMITVIPEGNKPRFVLTDGWLAPVKNRLSYHRAFGLFSFLNPKSKEYALDSSLNGEERAFVSTGVFEEVTPMDILPTHLIKAILSENYDEMEALGLFEVVEEDLALCEFIDVSKHEIQALIRKGINMLRDA